MTKVIHMLQKSAVHNAPSPGYGTHPTFFIIKKEQLQMVQLWCWMLGRHSRRGLHRGGIRHGGRRKVRRGSGRGAISRTWCGATGLWKTRRRLSAFYGAETSIICLNGWISVPIEGRILLLAKNNSSDQEDSIFI